MTEQQLTEMMDEVPDSPKSDENQKTESTVTMDSNVVGRGMTDLNQFAVLNGLKLGPHDYEVFSPFKFDEAMDDNNTESDSDVLTLLRETAQAKVRDRLPGTIGSLIGASLFLPVASLREWQITTVFSNAMAVLFAAYFAHLLTYFILAKKDGRILYRVYSITSEVSGWVRMSITYRAILLKTQAIESISEFSAISGGFANKMLLSLSINTWAVYTCVYAFQIRALGDYQLSFADIAVTVGTFGFMLVGSYELDPFDKIMKRIHYTGYGMVSLITIGFTTQQISFYLYYKQDPIYLIVPCLINTMALVAFIWWRKSVSNGRRIKEKLTHVLSSRDVTNEEEAKQTIDKNLRKITDISTRNIILELMVVICGAVSLVLYMYHVYLCWDTFGRNCY